MANAIFSICYVFELFFDNLFFLILNLKSNHGKSGLKKFKTPIKTQPG